MKHGSRTSLRQLHAWNQLEDRLNWFPPEHQQRAGGSPSAARSRVAGSPPDLPPGLTVEPASARRRRNDLPINQPRRSAAAPPQRRRRIAARVGWKVHFCTAGRPGLSPPSLPPLLLPFQSENSLKFRNSKTPARRVLPKTEPELSESAQRAGK